MIKHVGKHDQKKAILLFKEVPGEDDMCLLVYTETLPALVHDPLMKAVESDVGQNSNEITEVLNRTLMDNGQNLLTFIHQSGFIRKVPTNQFILTPNPSTTIRLDELNSILKQMAEGDEAKQKMAELDAQAGMKDPAKTLADSPVAEATPEIVTEVDGVLTDAGLAKSNLDQAEQMEAQAQVLINEAKILRNDAYEMAPELKPKATKKKAASTKKAATTVKKRGPGRPRKNAAATS